MNHHHEPGLGAVVVTHGSLGEALYETAEAITGPIPHLLHVSVDARDDVEEIRGRILEAVREVDQGAGVLLLVDMFGGTPSNIGISFLERDKVEVVTGVNLPMLTKFATLWSTGSLQQTAGLLREHAREHIKVVSEYLSEK